MSDTDSRVKLLVSALPAVGKTTLLQTLKDAFIVARDGKKYPFPQPHVNVPDFSSADEFIEIVSTKIAAYEERFGELPATVVFDSISKVLLDVEGYVLQQVKSFPYGKVNTEIKKIVDFIERDLAPVFNIVLVSHAMFDEEVGGYKLVNAGGSYGKKGGMLSEVDEAIFLDLKGQKRTVLFRDSKRLSRTTVADLPESMPVEEFSLQEHLELLMAKQSDAEEWTL